MSQGIHFVSTNIIPGYGPAEGKCLLCSGGSGRAVSISSYSSCRVSLVKNLVAKSPVLVSKRTSSFVANSSDNRRNPDFSKQNKQNQQNNQNNNWFPKNKNKQNHNKDNFENHEDSEMLSSENGPAFSVSSSPTYKATATPGPREKEIVELFRKVQAQLRERAAIREKNKTEDSEGEGQEDETVESLLKLLRKHSAEQGDRKSSSDNNTTSRSDSVISSSNNNTSRRSDSVISSSNNNTSRRSDSVMEQHDQNDPSDEEKIPGLLNSNNSFRLDAQRTSPKPFKRPISNFRRKSPVPKVKFQPVYTAEDDIGSNSSINSQGRIKTEVEPKPEPKPYPELDDEFDSDSDGDEMFEPKAFSVSSNVNDEVFASDSESEDEEMLEPEAFSVSSNVNDEVLAETSETESSDIDEAYHDEVVGIDSSTQQADLNKLKLSDLKVLAKSRGLKGFSKLKKADLVELLSGGSG